MEPDPQVTIYLDGTSASDRVTLASWRARCLELPVEFREELHHGMPCYVRDERVELGFASQKRYLSL